MHDRTRQRGSFGEPGLQRRGSGDVCGRLTGRGGELGTNFMAGDSRVRTVVDDAAAG